MSTWIALFRGINVGGKNILPMAELRLDFESLGCENVRTYIQSGNVVFESTARNASSLAKKIGQKIEDQRGFRPQILILASSDLKKAIAGTPFPKAVTEPNRLHFFFLAKPATAPKTEALENAKTSTESYQLTDRVFYLHAPDGIGQSKLAASAEKYLGVTTTARNFRTVEKLLAMTE